MTATAVSFDRVDLLDGRDRRPRRDRVPDPARRRPARDRRPGRAHLQRSQRRAGDRLRLQRAGGRRRRQRLRPEPGCDGHDPARTVFLDGFESGDLSRTGGAGITVEQGGAFAGSFAARAATTSSARYRYKQLASTYRELHYRLRFKLVSQADSFSLLKLRTASGSPLARLWLSATGKLSTRNDLTGATTTSTTQITPGAGTSPSWPRSWTAPRAASTSGSTATRSTP